MASNYEALGEDHSEIRAKLVRAGELAADLYADRTHFIFELLQNAEDALGRPNHSPRSRTVRFDLSEESLHVSHYGKPFDHSDVKGICDIALGTKAEDLTQIGRFGVGFKSVFRVTARPEIHSGSEDFVIEDYFFPHAAQPIERGPDQTVFIMPLRDPDENREEIARGLRRIGLDTLLFLREVETIDWTLPNGESGRYVRQSSCQTCLGKRPDTCQDVRKVTVVGESTDQGDAERSWLVFSTPMYALDDILAGHVEVAFLIEDARIVPVSPSPLVVFFPTVVDTHLGFRIQGPYRTTPSRDNVPETDEWNQECIEKTGDVLVDALVWLRDHNMLDVDVLRCLPIDRGKFDDESRFATLYESVKDALRSHDLLPTFGGGHMAAPSVKLARTQELRELFDRKQIKRLFKSNHAMSWLTDGVSQDRTPDLRTYLMEELDVDEVTPQTILSKLDRSFLRCQSNGWMCRLYEFLRGQARLHPQAKGAPIIRLSDGTHVSAFVDDAPQAFLPGSVKTGFPTIHADVCQSADARQFLRMIDLSEPHLVDDVVRNVLPKYDGDDCEVSEAEYAEDIDRILAASRTPAADKRWKLIQRLREAQFVRAVRVGDGACFASPNGLYLATERLKALFEGVAGIEIVDDRCDALRGNRISDLLEACGAVGHLLPIKRSTRVGTGHYRRISLTRLREQEGHAETSGRTDSVTDWEVRGLNDVLAQLASLDSENQRGRAKHIWEALIQLQELRKESFHAKYRWSYYGDFDAEFDSAFIQQLNRLAWIPSEDGGLQRPHLVLFDSLGWPDDPFLLTKIRFKPPIVDQLAAEAGFEPAMLDRLKERGITSLAELEKLLPEHQPGVPSDVNPVAEAMSAPGIAAPDGPMVDDPSAERSHASEGGSGPPVPLGGYDGRSKRTASRSSSSGGHAQQTRPTSASSRGSAPFISYVAVDHEDSADESGDLDHDGRMELEKWAIAFILSHEEDWQRTRKNNPGFDLVKIADDQEWSWCEVKAMKASLHDRPVGLSHTQFKCAQERGDAYWLYVVECAGGENARIVRIRDPAGQAKTFTFDKGWLAAAERD